MRPQLREINHTSAIWLHAFLFLLVFFDSQARIRLLGEVDRASPVDNQRRRGAAIAGFKTCCSEAGSSCVKFPPNRELSEPFGRSGHPSSYQVVIRGSGVTVRFALTLVCLISPLSYRPQKNPKTN